jgi:hypothetical protein
LAPNYLSASTFADFSYQIATAVAVVIAAAAVAITTVVIAFTAVYVAFTAIAFDIAIVTCTAASFA